MGLRVISWALLLSGACTGACGLIAKVLPIPDQLKDKPCTELPFEVYVKAADVLNLNPEGQALPVELRIYLLSSRDAFDGLDFEALWKKGPELLGKDLLIDKPVALTVFPAEEKIQLVNGPTNTKYVALVALFRQIEGSSWKKVVDVKSALDQCKPDGLHLSVPVQLQDNRVIANEALPPPPS